MAKATGTNNPNSAPDDVLYHLEKNSGLSKPLTTEGILDGWSKLKEEIDNSGLIDMLKESDLYITCNKSE